MKSEISRNDRLLGGLWGALVGDALGVPVEFRNRESVQSDPVTTMRGYGTHQQPAGTWSDDGSLLLCAVDSLLRHEFDTEDMGKRFLSWFEHGTWSANGDVFDVGLTTTDAMLRIRSGVPAEEAGGREEHSNGNGSLMRILPIALRFASHPVPTLIARVGRASAITHGHERSKLACSFYSLLVRDLLNASRPHAASANAPKVFNDTFAASPELRHFREITEDISAEPEASILSTGYAIHTLTASLWCLLTTDNFRDCVLKAVNLGGDTDTTGCVAGGLAGIAYGITEVPKDWIQQLPRQQELADLFKRFAELP